MVESKRAVKYLVVLIDSKLSFFEQIRLTVDKGMLSLSRLMINIGGPKSSRRKILMAAVLSVELYGAEAWPDPWIVRSAGRN